MLSAIKTWGDTGQRDEAACSEPRKLKLAEDECLVVFIPKMNMSRATSLRKTLGELRKRMGWRGEIMLMQDDIRLEIVKVDEAKRLPEAQARASAQSANLGISALATAESFGRRWDSLRKSTDALAAVKAAEVREALDAIGTVRKSVDDEEAADFGDWDASEAIGSTEGFNTSGGG